MFTVVALLTGRRALLFLDYFGFYARASISWQPLFFFFACVVLRFCRIFLAYNLSKMASAKDDYRSHPDRWSTRVSLELQNVSAPTHFGVNNKLPPR
jgi:hypothetical protein